MKPLLCALFLLLPTLGLCQASNSVSLLTFGADPTGHDDAAPAFNRALAAAKHIIVPPGQYLLAGAATVALLSTVPLTTPGLVAQPAVPRTMGPFAPEMNPSASHAACAELPKASNVIASITARPEVGMTAATTLASTLLAGTRASTFPRIWASFGQSCLRAAQTKIRNISRSSVLTEPVCNKTTLRNPSKFCNTQ